MTTSRQIPDRQLQGTEANFHRSPYAGNDPRRKNPIYAGLLSFLPGLGQVYVGYYRRGFINILVAASIFSVLASAPGNPPYRPRGIFFRRVFELDNVIDAVRRATMLNLTLEGVEQIDLPDELTNKSLSGSYLGGGALLVFGAIALSYTAFDMSLDWLNEWWPVAPIGFGAYLVYKAYIDSQASATGPD